MIFDLYAVIRNSDVHLAHDLWDTFSGVSSFCIACVYIDCSPTNLNRLTMSLTSPLSLNSNAFPFYCDSCFSIYWNYCHQPNQICSCLLIFCDCCNPTNYICPMTSLTMMGQTTGPLVRELFLFTLENTLVVLVHLLVVFLAWRLEFFSQQELIQLVTLFCWSCLNQKESSPKVVDSLNVLAPKILIFPPSFKISFGTTVLL